VPFRWSAQLLPGEGPATRSAVPLHSRDGQRVGRLLRLPDFRQFASTARADHDGAASLLLTGRMVTFDPKPLSSVMPKTFLACCFAFSSVRNLLG
jgi:hypothetical protein